jgi:hypothetical protein
MGNSESNPEQIWTKEDFCKQIKIFDNEISLLFNVCDIKKDDCLQKLTENDLKELKEDLKKLYLNYVGGYYNNAELNIIDIKTNMYKIINMLCFRERIKYLAILYGFFPIVFAVIAMFVSFFAITSFHFCILGVPLWASCLAVIGASVQILIGVANDYNDGYVMTEYRRLWYVILPFVSFAFGFLVFFLVTGGLISITSGYSAYNRSANTISTTMGSFCIDDGSSPIHSVIPIITCFLAGFSTNWFIRLLQNYTYKT